MRRLSRAIVEQLSSALQLPVEIDNTGSAVHWAILHFVLGPGRTIHPTSIRIADDEENARRLRQVNITSRCDRYNLVIGELRKLRDRYDALAQRGYLVISEGTPLWMTGQSLGNLNDDIERHQLSVMKGNVIALEDLDSQCHTFESYYQRLSTMIQQAEAMEEEKICEADTVINNTPQIRRPT